MPISGKYIIRTELTEILLNFLEKFKVRILGKLKKVWEFNFPKICPANDFTDFKMFEEQKQFLFK